MNYTSRRYRDNPTGMTSQGNPDREEFPAGFSL
jgi:hypothetical protein